MGQKAVFILIVGILLLGSTFAGLSLFGMNHTMGMDSETCLNGYCASTSGMQDGMTGVTCIDHCLKTTAPETTVPTMLTLVFTVLFLTFYFSDRLKIPDTFLSAVHRWHGTIGKFILQQNLATVVLRN